MGEGTRLLLHYRRIPSEDFERFAKSGRVSRELNCGGIGK